MEEVKPSSSFHTLMEEYESTKKALGEAEETLKRITGRNPDQFNGPMNKDEEIQGPKPEEDSPDEAEPSAKKPSLQSTVVANLKDVKSRKDTIQEQNVNSKVKARCLLPS
ncbi:hypothetical protein JTE90_010097 [Oedothorax gibbosus]|uniref:Uncharacterized protein n=1 Tax=Oedothorax gibbosus TaxID=931172 RepID=A0AAV6U3M8_9ARAC|nr:hypothetical protein JTE90_010097 [Oedothorax gibbosus]